MTRKQPETLLDYLNLATDYLTRHTVDHPRLNAEMLLCEALGMKRLELYLQFDRPLSTSEVDAFRDMLRRRGTRQPLQYILGHEEFYGRRFLVTPDVLIPRPETEILVETVLKRLKDRTEPVIADIGTGSGCIAVTLAAEIPGAHVTAADISDAALTVARKNARNAGVEEAVSFVQGDLLAPLRGKQFDAIVSNPPYVPEGDRDGMQPEVRDYEPALALFSGPDGLSIIREIVAGCAALIRPGGLVALEIGIHQSGAVRALWREHAPDWNVEVVQDLAGIDRIILAACPESS